VALTDIHRQSPLRGRERTHARPFQQLTTLLLCQDAAPLIELTQLLQQVFLRTQPDLATEIQLLGFLWVAVQDVQKVKGALRTEATHAAPSQTAIGLPCESTQANMVFMFSLLFVAAQCPRGNSAPALS